MSNNKSNNDSMHSNLELLQSLALRPAAVIWFQGLFHLFSV